MFSKTAIALTLAVAINAEPLLTLAPEDKINEHTLAPVDKIHESFTSSLLNAGAWASYKEANGKHAAKAAGLRKARKEAVTEYFAAKTKAASASSTFDAAKTA